MNKLLNLYTMLLTLGLVFTSCGKDKRRDPYRSSQQPAHPVTTVDNSLAAQAAANDPYLCEVNNCASDVPILLKPSGDYAKKGFIGKSGEKVKWGLSIGNEYSRDLGIRLDDARTTSAMYLKYPNAGNVSSAEILWKPTKAEEGSLYFFTRDIKRCTAVTGDEARCENMSIASDLDSPLEVPFKVVGDLSSENEVEEWKQLLACAGAAASSYAFGGTVGGVAGAVVNGLYYGGESTCKVDSTQEGAVYSWAEEADFSWGSEE